MPQGKESGTPFQATASKADGTDAVASQAAVAGKRHHITAIAGSSDKAGALLSVKDGSTVIWEVEIGAGLFSQTFEYPLFGTVGNAVSVTVDSTSLGKANIAGYTTE